MDTNAAEESFEDVWEAKYGAEPEQASTPEPEAVTEPSVAAETEPQAGAAEPSAEAPEQPQAQPQTEPVAAQTPPTPSPEAEELEALRKRYEGTKARYQAEERKRKELEERVRSLESQRTPPPVALDLDETESAEIEAFRKKHPEIAKQTVDDPRLAAHWQKLLLERGADEVVVTYETARGAASGATEDLRVEQRRRDEQAHLSAIEAEHPDWFNLVYAPGSDGEAPTPSADFERWVGMLPLNVGQGVVWALQQGTAAQINTVLTAYKAFRANAGQAQQAAPAARGTGSTPAPRTPQQQAAVQAARAVPTRGGGTPPPNARASGDASFEELWEAKYGR